VISTVNSPWGSCPRSFGSQTRPARFLNSGQSCHAPQAKCINMRPLPLSTNRRRFSRAFRPRRRFPIHEVQTTTSQSSALKEAKALGSSSTSIQRRGSPASTVLTAERSRAKMAGIVVAVTSSTRGPFLDCLSRGQSEGVDCHRGKQGEPTGRPAPSRHAELSAHGLDQVVFQGHRPGNCRRDRFRRRFHAVAAIPGFGKYAKSDSWIWSQVISLPV